ncbi:MAG: hypothetical protein A3J40_02140 [Erythrobacter sp. RIFCSPHIGHO2_12_FULL_63_10]|nr:MAG: hypothetical protein A3J40_02140 [Erythrobacter sp. RIFCSPHIGHO2_12_FULL_63_10]
MPQTATLAETMMQQPMWLQAWIGILMAVNLAAVLFVVRREGGGWRICWPALAILGAFFGAAMLMNWLYDQYGYVRLLGLAHLVFWTPVYGWILMKRKAIAAPSSWFGKYLLAYLVVDGASLAIDVADVARYFSGTA